MGIGIQEPQALWTQRYPFNVYHSIPDPLLLLLQHEWEPSPFWTLCTRQTSLFLCWKKTKYQVNMVHFSRHNGRLMSRLCSSAMSFLSILMIRNSSGWPGSALIATKEPISMRVDWSWISSHLHPHLWFSIHPCSLWQCTTSYTIHWHRTIWHAHNCILWWIALPVLYSFQKLSLSGRSDDTPWMCRPWSAQ